MNPTPRPQPSNSRRRGLTLFELLIALVIGVVLMVMLVNSVIKARQRALVAALVEGGGRTDLNPDGSVRMLDLSHVGPAALGDNLERMSRLESLFALNLNHTAVTHEELEPVFGTMDLVQLHLCGTDITDESVDVIISQPRLDMLDARATFLSDDGIRRIAEGLPAMRNLRLSETWVTDAGLKHLSALKHLAILDLRGTDVTDNGLETIRHFPALKTVRLNATRVTMDGAKKLKRARPEVRIEFADHATSYHEYIGLGLVNYLAPDELGQQLQTPATPMKLRHLARVGSYSCMLRSDESGQAFQQLPRLRDLSTLRVRGQWLADEDLNDLWKNHRLSGLDLYDTPVTDACLSAISRCRMLQYLNLGGTRITGERLGELRHCRALRTLDLNNATLSDEGLDQLATLTSLPVLTSLTLPISSNERDKLLRLSPLLTGHVTQLQLSDIRLAGRTLRKFVQNLPREKSASLKQD